MGFVVEEWRCKKCGAIVVNPAEAINPTHDWDTDLDQDSDCNGELEFLGGGYTENS